MAIKGSLAHSNRTMTEEWRQRIQVAKVLDRLSKNVNGGLDEEKHAANRLIKKLYEKFEKITGLEIERKSGDQGSLRKMIIDCLRECRMDNSQVKSAEILLKKCLPDIAHVEHKVEGKVTNIVQVPTLPSLDQWHAKVIEPQKEAIEQDK
jgi:hypothetical protein